MAHQRPLFPRSPTSRASLTSVGQMPVIDEDDEARTAPKPPAVPLRSPQRSYRRSMARGLPPPYVPATYLPPVYRPPYLEAAERKKAADLEAGKDPKKVAAGATAASRLRKRSSDKDWKNDSRRRSCRFVALLLVLMAIVVGLAVGLTLGLKDRGKHDSSSLEAASSRFPAGSFAFNTTLRRTATDCTSNPATWRCYPYEQGSPATFFWIVSAVSSHAFAVSSSDNPFAPAFANVSMRLVDGNQPAERFVFSFSTDTVVVPSDALTPGNRAARCAFDDTEFEATVWTRRRGGATVRPPDRAPGEGFVEWPGDVEVAQVKKAQPGSPKCEDVDGAVIADVQAGAGTCECRYANF
jgi:hypothetical protein